MSVIESNGRRRVKMIFDDGTEKGRSFSASNISDDISKEDIYEITEAIAEVLDVEADKVENVQTTYYRK